MSEKFDYLNLKGKSAKYTPDFYVKNWDTYIEVKGYEDKLSKCKKRQFQYSLEIWGKTKIRQIEKFLDLKAEYLKRTYQDCDKVISFGEVTEFGRW